MIIDLLFLFLSCLIVFVVLANRKREWIIVYEMNDIRVSRIFISFRKKININRLKKSFPDLSRGGKILSLKEVDDDNDYSLK